VSLRGPRGEKGDKGDPGTPGKPGLGARIFSVTARPDDSVGAVGDYYIDTLQVALYGPKTAAGWPSDGISLRGAPGPQGLPGDPGPQGPAGADGKSGARTVNFNWMLINFGQSYGYGTYTVSHYGGLVDREDPLILPINCRKATLRIGTLGKLAQGSTYTFNVLHRPGPDFYAAGALPKQPTAVSCVLSASATTNQNACLTVVDNLSWLAGDAIQMQMVGNKAMRDMEVVGHMMLNLFCEE